MIDRWKCKKTAPLAIRWCSRAREEQNIMSTTQAETRHQSAIALGVMALQIVQEIASRTDHPQQTLAAVVILLVLTEMFGQFRDARR